MSLDEALDGLLKLAKRDESVKCRLMETRKEKEPVAAFCKAACELGFPIYEMDLIMAGEEYYAAMRRSTNGGGENSPALAGEEDYYELFFSSLSEI